MMPEKAEVVLLGDGEFDGTILQEMLCDFNWKYVCRTAKNAKCYVKPDESINADDLVGSLKKGEYRQVSDILFTGKKYGPVSIVGWWKKENKSPIYLVTNMDSARDVCNVFCKRIYIETFFSDQKSRGFNLHKSHISDPSRLSRLMIATCLAYIWMIHLGEICMDRGWLGNIHRTYRCDLSLFQIGFRFLEFLLNEGLRIPVAFKLLV
jgi:hypothetical protein